MLAALFPTGKRIVRRGAGDRFKVLSVSLVF
jgi:hypothetical protein